MATIPATPLQSPTKRVRKANGTTSTKHTLTLIFGEKYADLFEKLKKEAEEDDRPMSVYVVRLLDSFKDVELEVAE